jgi:hypothetical protein
VRAVRLAVLLAAALSVAGCGGGGTGNGTDTAVQWTLGAELERPGPDVALVQGTADYAAGPIRTTFLVIDSKSRAIESPKARVWVGPSLDKPPLVTTEATLDSIGIPGESESAAGGVSKIYVAHFSLPKPGKYVMVAEPDGAKIQGMANLQVARHPQAPAVGAEAIPSRTPTLGSTHGNVGALTTADPPDLALLRYSVADSIKAHVPFVLVFATPKFCQSRTCGPEVDVVQAVQKEFAGSPIRFIHVEIYKDNNPAQGYNRWVGEWRLPSEPWVFLVGRDGKIKQRFEGSVSVAELTAAVHERLAG